MESASAPRPWRHALRWLAALDLMAAIAVSARFAAAEDFASLRDKLHPFEEPYSKLCWTDSPSPGGEEIRWTEADASAFKRVMDELQEEWFFERKLRGEIAAGFTGDRAEGGSGVLTDELYKLLIGAALRRGEYPGRFRLEANVNVQLSEGEVNEDVTAFTVSYGYFTRKWWEVYGFAERFSDSFLQIDQRYEVGAGSYFSHNFFGTTPAADRELCRLRGDPADSECLEHRSGEGGVKERSGNTDNSDTPASGAHRAKCPFGSDGDNEHGDDNWQADVLRKAYRATHGDGVEQCPKKSGGVREERGRAPTVTEEPGIWARSGRPRRGDFLELCRQREQSRTSIERRYAELELGVALSVFAELEQASLTTGLDLDGEEVIPPQTVKLEGEEQLRWTIRPTLIYRTDHLKIKVYPYFKLPLGSPSRPPAKGDANKFDYRIDLYASAEYALKPADTPGDERVSIVVKYDFHYDNVPPHARLGDLPENYPERVPHPQIPGQWLSLTNPVAPQKHQFFALMLKVQWD